jgi:hypothetical protein
LDMEEGEVDCMGPGGGIRCRGLEAGKGRDHD